MSAAQENTTSTTSSGAGTSSRSYRRMDAMPVSRDDDIFEERVMRMPTSRSLVAGGAGASSMTGAGASSMTGAGAGAYSYPVRAITGLTTHVPIKETKQEKKRDAKDSLEAFKADVFPKKG
jgi:hypothetical protein